MSNEVSGLPLMTSLLVLLFTLSGVTLKLADYYGERDRSYLGYLTAIISAGCMGLLMADNAVTSSMVLGIIVGVILAGKVDRRNLVLGLCLTLMTSVILGFDFPDLRLLAVIGMTSLVDEVAHDRLTRKGDVIAGLFRFRIGLKTIMVMLTALMWVEVIYTFGFFSFDIAYDVTGIFIERRVGG